ncbi:MAG: serine hydrolase, partial [Bacteroidota bacterium]
MNKVIITCLFFLISHLVSSQSDKELLGEFDQKIESLLQDFQAVGLSVAVVKDGEVIYSKGFGYRDLAAQLPADENTVFHIASMSKAFTGTLLGILESEDRVSLQDKPSLYIPDFQFYNEKMDNLITIGDLLSHRSGIGSQGSSIIMFPEYDKLKTVQRLRYLKPEGEVKNSWVYSNLGYTLAGTIVEQITNTTWDQNIQERIFDPLEMNTSYTTIEDMEKTGNYSKGYARYKGNTEEVSFEDYYAWAPAGAIKSSVKDLSNWMLVWLNNGVFNGRQVIPQQYVRAASSLQNLKEEVYEKDAFLYGEGYGWRLRAWNGHFRIRHGGNTNGFSTIMDMFPFEKIGIVVLCNQKNSLLPYAISDYISRKLYQLPEFTFPIKVDDHYKSTVEDIPLNEEEPPAHPLKAFIGEYQAKGFGKIKVIQENDQLFAVLPTYKFQLAHLNYNSFYLKGTEAFDGEFDPEFTVQFCANTEGEIVLLKLYS